MTDQEINQAIAEACGWVAMPDGPDYLPPGSLKTQMVPSYPTDLNAMHEAEKHTYKTQPPGWMARYEDHLSEVCSRAQYPHWMPIFATARQRAEAFLRTRGKWKE